MVAKQEQQHQEYLLSPFFAVVIRIWDIAINQSHSSSKFWDAGYGGNRREPYQGPNGYEKENSGILQLRIFQSCNI